MRLFINGLAARAGGGLTYLRNVIPNLARRTDVQATVLLTPRVRSEFAELPNISFVEIAVGEGSLLRLLHEQRTLPNLVQRHAAQVLISTGNFALWNSPVPQILLSRNALYTSGEFLRDVWSRRDYTIWADTLIKGWFARRSIRRADITVSPSEAFALELSQWAGKKVASVHHGFDRDAFAADPAPLPLNVQHELEKTKDALRLLFVSHYNYYRNFETLFRALPLISRHLDGKKVKLFLTCRLTSVDNPGSYRAEAASALVGNLRASENIVELGSVPYRSLHHLYRACHIYVTPAYAESFAHPLVESMSSGLPVVASDLPVHREICRDAALYFPYSAPDALASRIIEVYQPTVSARLSQNGLRRALDFSWSEHVDRLLSLAKQLVRSNP